MHSFIKFIFGMKLYMFRQFLCPSSGVFSLYTQQWYMSYSSADSLRAGSRWNAVPSWSWFWFCCFWGVYFIINDLVYFIDWNIITLNGRSIIMTFLFDWMSLLFMGFVFIISSLVILYSDDNMFGDLNIVPFYYVGLNICYFYDVFNY